MCALPNREGEELRGCTNQSNIDISPTASCATATTVPGVHTLQYGVALASGKLIFISRRNQASVSAMSSGPFVRRRKGDKGVNDQSKALNHPHI